MAEAKAVAVQVLRLALPSLDNEDLKAQSLSLYVGESIKRVALFGYDDMCYRAVLGRSRFIQAQLLHD